MPTKSELIAGNITEDEIQDHLKVDALLYQKIDDLVEAVTRKGDHHIDTPCMACLDGNYVANDIDEAKIVEMGTIRTNDRNCGKGCGFWTPFGSDIYHYLYPCKIK